jgi:hypothetical protein
MRLIKLHRPPLTSVRVPKADAVHCDIESFDIETAPEYIALSYTWGSPNELQTIYIDDKPFVVRQNLFDFLDIFRLEETNTRHLWIDQLCIDQMAVDERNHQVRLMSQIYQKSKFVVMWLGASSETHAIVFLAEPDVARARDLFRIDTLLGSGLCKRYGWRQKFACSVARYGYRGIASPAF